MIEKIQYGPVEFLPPVPVSQAILELRGIKAVRHPYTTYVFLDDVHGVEIEDLIKVCNYAGNFSMAMDSSLTVRLDITTALNHALKIRPNFNIMFLTRYEGTEGGERGDSVFGFETLEIFH